MAVSSHLENVQSSSAIVVAITEDTEWEFDLLEEVFLVFSMTEFGKCFNGNQCDLKSLTIQANRTLALIVNCTRSVPFGAKSTF